MKHRFKLRSDKSFSRIAQPTKELAYLAPIARKRKRLKYFDAEINLLKEFLMESENQTLNQFEKITVDKTNFYN